MRRLALIGGWVLVVTLATALTWQVVGAVDDRVSDRPASPLNIAAPSLNNLTTPTTMASTATTALPPISSTTTPPATSSTVSTNPTTTTATSTTPPAPTTTAVAAWQVEVTSTEGGTVVVQYRPDEVVLEATSPGAGFRVEIEKSGPPEVEVEFESEDLKVEYRAKWKDGQLDIEVSESGKE